MRNVNGVEQAIFQENNIQERYIIEVFWSDYNRWSNATKAAVLASHLFEITPDVETKNSADCSGFKIMYKALGVNWERDGFEFDLELRPGLAELEAMDEGDDPDDV